MPLYLLLDTAVVGRLGAEQLAALGAAAAVQSVVTTQLTFLSYGTTARSSRLFGSGDKQGAIAEGVQATYVALIVGFGLACVIWLFGGQIALWMTGNPETAKLSASWLHVAAFAIPITLVEMAGNGWLRGIQDTKKPLYFTLAGLIPGAIAVPFFVHWWGLVGSAWANVLGMGIIALLFVQELLKQHTGSWRLRPQVIKRQLVLGRDLIIRSASLQAAFLSAAAVAARFGTAPLAAHQVMLQIWNFLTLVLDSLAIAAQTLIGSALGAKSVDVARNAGQKIIRYSVIFSGALAAVFALGAGIIPRIFTQDAAVLEAMRRGRLVRHRWRLAGRGRCRFPAYYYRWFGDRGIFAWHRYRLCRRPWSGRNLGRFGGIYWPANHSCCDPVLFDAVGGHRLALR